MAIRFEDLGMTIRRENQPLRPSYSAWFITINSNQKPTTFSHMSTLEMKLKNGLRETLAKDNWPSLFKFKRGGIDDIKAIDVKVSTEIGSHPKGSRVHVHAYIEVEHFARIHLNYGVFHALVRENVMLPHNIYINIQPVKPQKNLERYLKKGSTIPSYLQTSKGFSQV